MEKPVIFPWTRWKPRTRMYSRSWLWVQTSAIGKRTFFSTHRALISSQRGEDTWATIHTETANQHNNITTSTTKSQRNHQRNEITSATKSPAHCTLHTPHSSLHKPLHTTHYAPHSSLHAIHGIRGIKTISIFSTFRFSRHTFQLFFKDDMGWRKNIHSTIIYYKTIDNDIRWYMDI